MNLHPKVAAGGMGGALALIVLWAMSYGVTVPVEVGSAFTGVIILVCAWLAPWFASVRPGPKDPPTKS